MRRRPIPDRRRPISFENLENREVLSAHWAHQALAAMGSLKTPLVEQDASDLSVILGPDDRRLVQDPMDSPYSAVGLVVSRFGDNLYVGTGTMIGRNHVLTAAHVVYNWPDAENPVAGVAQEVYFVPAMSGADISSVSFAPYLRTTRQPFGAAQATEILVNPDYRAAQSFAEDYAVLRLDRNLGDYTGYMDIVPDPGNNYLLNTTFTTVGYPADLNPFTTSPFEADFRFANVTPAGELESVTLDVSSGQSGSPVFVAEGRTRPAVVAVVVAGGDRSTGASRLDSDAFQKMLGWLQRDGQVVDRPDLVSLDAWFGTSFDYMNNISNEAEASTFTVAIRNNGTATSTPVTVEFREASTNDLIGRATAPAIAPFQTELATLTIPRPYIRPDRPLRSIRYTIDVDQRLSEFGEQNNIGQIPRGSILNAVGNFTPAVRSDTYFVDPSGKLEIPRAIGPFSNDQEGTDNANQRELQFLDRPSNIDVDLYGRVIYSAPDGFFGVQQVVYRTTRFNQPYFPGNPAATVNIVVGDYRMFDLKPKPLPYRVGSFLNGRWFWDSSNDFQVSLADDILSFGTSGDRPIVGDWNGDGTDDAAVRRGDTWFLDSNSIPGWQGNDTAIPFGLATDQAIAGDWNGDGKDDLGVFRAGMWFLDTNGQLGWQGNDTAVRFGVPTDTPVVGDWDGDGKDDLGVVRGATWFLDTNKTRGWQGNDTSVSFGVAGDIPIVSDWNGDGKDDLGVRRAGILHIDSNGTLGWQGNDRSISYVPREGELIVGKQESTRPKVQTTAFPSIDGVWMGLYDTTKKTTGALQGFVYDITLSARSLSNSPFNGELTISSPTGTPAQFMIQQGSTSLSSSRGTTEMSYILRPGENGLRYKDFPVCFNSTWDDGDLILNFLDGTYARLKKVS